MKKFMKLAAVFAALVLALSCFVACSSDDDDGDDSALAGLWIEEDDDFGEGFYVVGNKMYDAYYINGKYYYVAENPSEFTVNENEITFRYEDGYTEKCTFEIIGDTSTIIWSESDVFISKKVNKKPIKVNSYEELEEMFEHLFGSSKSEDD